MKLLVLVLQVSCSTTELQCKKNVPSDNHCEVVEELVRLNNKDSHSRGIAARRATKLTQHYVCRNTVRPCTIQIRTSRTA